MHRNGEKEEDQAQGLLVSVLAFLAFTKRRPFFGGADVSFSGYNRDMPLSLVNRALIGCLALAGVCALGCSLLSSSLSPSQQRALDAHKCYHAALEPVVGELADEFLKATLAGGDLAKALIVHGVRIEDVIKSAHAFEQCAINAASPSEAAPVGNTDL